MHEHKALIEQLGGRAAVALAVLGVADPKTMDVVRKWETNGIPWKFRPTVAGLAKRRRIALPDAFLAAPVAA